MAANTASSIEPTRFESRRAFVVAGLQERYASAGNAQIPLQWQRFAPHIGKVPGQVGATTYGVCVSVGGSNEFDYIAAVEVKEGADVPKGLVTLRVPERRYAVFEHRDHVSTIRETMEAIHRWLPRSGHKPASAPMFERYGEKFDPQTGRGDIEIWIPVQ
jgi:AraC family transcriptional regulator